MPSLRLYWRYLSISVRAQLQYRLSFCFYVLGHFFITFADLVVVIVLFKRFDNLGGWKLPEVALLYGMVNMSFALAEGIARGFDVFPQMVKSGDFDRLLLRPQPTAFQVAASEIQLFRIGRFTQGLIAVCVSLYILGVSYSLENVLLLLFAIFGGCCLFSALFVIQATIAFWTVDTIEIMNALTYGGTEAGSYPLHIYSDWFRRLFTIFVPLACTTYFPALVVLQKQGSWYLWLSPLVGLLYLALALLIWRVGVRHYCSTGS